MWLSGPFVSTKSKGDDMAMENGRVSTLPETRKLERAADILKTVAHPARLRIIDFLEGWERAVAEICRQLDAPQPYVSQQLNLMKAKEILSSRRNGNQVFYSIANLNVVKIIHCVQQHGDGDIASDEGCSA
jgi:DNA-binding transcriptional ArsR family regulator